MPRPGALSLLQRFLGGSGSGAAKDGEPAATAPDPAGGPASAPDGETLYVVGDIHGRSDMLNLLLRKIVADAAEDEAAGSGPGGRELILLGDYVDRGPDSRGVVDAILKIREERAFWRVTALKGNHEAAFMAFLREPAYWPMWADYGARETLNSYGVNPPARISDEEDWARAQREMNEALPPEHRAFFEGLELAAPRGDYLCVHAGVRPDLPLEAQTENDLLWIREDFLKNQKRLEKVVVHGHTPAADAYVGEHRIGLDTGAYATSILSAIKLKGADRVLIQARGKD